MFYDNPQLDPVWPVAWIPHVGTSTGAGIIIALNVVSGFAGALFWRFKWVRALVTLSLLQTGALLNSFGGISHGYHEWIWLSFVFLVFLPAGDQNTLGASRTLRFGAIGAVVYAQALILLFYTMSGAFKVFIGLLFHSIGATSVFSIDAMAIQLADRSTQTGTTPLLAPLIIDNPVLGWPLYTGLVLLELFAIVFLFRPQLHRFVGTCLIAFHFGTYLFMEIIFPLHVLINGLLFLMSPFAPRHVTVGDMVRALPVVGGLARVVWRREASVSAGEAAAAQRPQREVAAGAQHRIEQARETR